MDKTNALFKEGPVILVRVVGHKFERCQCKGRAPFVLTLQSMVKYILRITLKKPQQVFLTLLRRHLVNQINIKSGVICQKTDPVADIETSHSQPYRRPKHRC